MANLVVGTNDTTKYLYFLKRLLFSNMNLPPQKGAVLRTFSFHLFSCPVSLHHFVRSASLLSRHVASRRVALVVKTGALLSSYHSLRVAFSEIRIEQVTRRVVNGHNLRLSFTLQAEPCPTESNKTEIIRLGKQTYVMKWKHLHCSPNRTGLSLNDRFRSLMVC